MKKFITAVLLIFIFMTGCENNGRKQNQTLTPEELTTKYKDAIALARDDANNEYPMDMITSADEDMSEIMLQLLNINPEDMKAFAISISPMNISAYGVAVIMPAEGKAEVVLEGVEGFVEYQQKSFENYLPNQKAIADAAVVKTLEDGTIILVMSENQDDIFAKIVENLK